MFLGETCTLKGLPEGLEVEGNVLWCLVMVVIFMGLGGANRCGRF